jgi:hypothetical protein
VALVGCFWLPSHLSSLHTQRGWHSLRLSDALLERSLTYIRNNNGPRRLMYLIQMFLVFWHKNGNVFFAILQTFIRADTLCYEACCNEACILCYVSFCIMNQLTHVNTGWSKSLCAPSDYNTESYKYCSKCPLPLSRHLLTRRTVFLKTVFSIARSTFQMYSVMAIFNLSVVWGLFEYTEFFIAPQRKKIGWRKIWRSWRPNGLRNDSVRKH